MSINITSDDVKVIDINGYYIRIIPSRNLISENIIQALGIHWTTWDGLAGIQWIYIDGVCYNFHSFDQLIQMCKIKDVAIPAMLHKYIYPFTIKKHDDLKENTIMTTNQLINIQQQQIGNDTVNAVSARELYAKLELSLAVWARWAKKNIEENAFFLEHIDWEGFNIVLNGNETKDYMLSLDFAKHLCMQARTKVAHDMRNYFIECEKKAQNPTPAEVGYSSALALLGVPEQIVPVIAKVYEERDEAVKTRGQIRDKQLASAMGTAGALANKMKALEAKVRVVDTIKTKAVEFATILAIQSRVENLKASGLKLANYCRKKGLEIHAIPDERYGKIQSYPAQAWKDVYNININKILGV
ncbi:MAG: hypothetical protein EKK54_11580 [Neisseriaceae bacterium]|nr:MAG: hypothetical protein EKK54_11580 [Neisseriaceae bacterium]